MAISNNLSATSTGIDNMPMLDRHLERAKMNDLDLNGMSLTELKQLFKDVEKAIDGFESRRKAEARAKAEEAAKQYGYSLSQLIEAATQRPAAAPKYAHPENPELTWSGRGRKPSWIIEGLDAGKSLEDFAI